MMDTAALRSWLEDLPAGTLLPAGELLARLDTTGSPPEAPHVAAEQPTAAERFCSCPDQTRLTVVELAEALHRPLSYVYGLTRSGMIPHLKLDGHVVFVASELRAWLVGREERIVQQKSVPISSRRTA